jgi:magnesium-protoporphyrin O-methyltransferase
MFGPRFSRHLSSRYRRRGLDRTAARIVDFVTSRGVDGATVLEVGGGIGDIQLELLRRGAEHATNLELVGVYDSDASQLAEAAGLSDRVTRRLVDIAATPEAVEPADVVILHRVVCCYPDYERLLSAAADHARHLLAFTHPPAAMVAVAEAHGMQAEYAHRGRVWQVVGLSRAMPAA